MLGTDDLDEINLSSDIIEGSSVKRRLNAKKIQRQPINRIRMLLGRAKHKSKKKITLATLDKL